MTPKEVLMVLMLFQLKHYLGDYILQSAWMVRGKGIYGDPGGLAHAGVHALLTIPVLMVTSIPIGAVLLIAVGEFIVHYHLDWAKDHIIHRKKLSPTQRGYWVFAGLDQYSHQMTYLVIVGVVLWLV